mgnify:CR=1 FL=1
MWNDVFQLAVKNGLWAVLFSALLIFVLKDSNRRENEYQQTIKDLTTHLGIVKDIKKQVEEVKDMVLKKSSKTNSKKSKIAKEETYEKKVD